MLDPNILRNNIDIVANKLARRNFKLDVDLVRNQEKKRKLLQIKTENLQYERNFRSKALGDAKSRGENIELLRIELNKLSKMLSYYKVELDTLHKLIRNYVLSIPNIPDNKVPTGSDENDNIEVFRWGEPHRYDFLVRDHVTLGAIIGGLDFSAAVKLTGSRFVVMRGQIARMHRALSQFMLDLHTEQHGYQEYYLPYLVNKDSLYGTGQLPKFNDDLFHTEPLKDTKNSAYSLIPTAEVPLTNLIRDKIIDEDDLPLKLSAHTPCFRSEASSYGRDNHGLIRMHQFDKVEMVHIVKPEQSMQSLEEMTSHAEKVLQLLNLPYRKLLLCTGDMSFASCKTYDLEVWLPAQNTYREISSCSNIGDFHARRIKARFRNKKEKKISFLHTLNGSGLAVGRTLVAIMENYQQKDGSIKVPKILQPYMNGVIKINAL